MSAKSFLSSLEVAIKGRQLPANLDPFFMREEFNSVLRQLPELCSYRQFLESTRLRRAAKSGGISAMDDAVVARADAARVVARRAATGCLGVLEHYKATGFLEDMMSYALKAGNGAGSIPIAELAALTLTPSSMDVLRECGFSKAQVEQMMVVASGLPGTVSVEENVLVFCDHERILRVRGIEKPTIELDEGILVRASPDLFTVAAANIRENGSTGLGLEVLSGTRFVREASLSQMVVGGITRLLQEMDGHVARLEETGLSTYSGETPAIVGGLILMAGGVGAIYLGVRSIDANGLNPGAVALFLLGIFLFAFGWGLVYTQIVSWWRGEDAAVV